MLVAEPFRYEITDFDREVFRRFMPSNHPLLAAERAVDWEKLRPAVESFYSLDRGQPAIDPVRMLKLEFLRYWKNLSDQQVMERTKTDVAFRCFLQVGHTSGFHVECGRDGSHVPSRTNIPVSSARHWPPRGDLSLHSFDV